MEDVINQIFSSQAGDYASDVEMESNGQFTNGGTELFLLYNHVTKLSMFIGNRHKNGSEVNNFINMNDADEEMGKF